MKKKAVATQKKIPKEQLPKWNLNDLYPGKDAKEIQQDIKKTETLIKQFTKKYKGKLAGLEGNILAGAIREYEVMDEILGRLMSYAYLLYAEKVTDQAHTGFYQDMSEKVNALSLPLLFFTLEINKIDEKELKKKLKDKALAHYAPWLRDVRIFRPYQLDDKVEEILHEKYITSRQSWNRLFDETLAGLRFPYNGKPLTCTEILDLLSSKEQEARKKAAKSLGKVLADNKKIFAMVTNVLAKDKEMEDKWRKFPLPISSRNVSNLIEDEVVETLIATVKRNYPRLSHRYYALKAKWSKKPYLNYWDRNAPLPEQDDRKIPWDEAAAMVTSAYRDFSPQMADIAQQFFDKNWIDAEVRDGKDSGAFSHSTVPSVHPYILMNYQGKVRDVMTLAHELGHGVHQVLAGKQGALMAGTPLTLAETASVFGEQLTFRKLLGQEKKPARKRVMIANKIEDMLNTVVRQVAFCEYERKVHHARRQGELSPEQIAAFWMEVQSESLGAALKFDKDYHYYWAYIPHFIHSPFYVYAYAFGDCLVNSLYRVYQKQPDGFEKKYLTMLKAGGTLRHKELLAPFGLDATHPGFWQGGLDMVTEFIDELEATI